jgi:hypothetical protein
MASTMSDKLRRCFVIGPIGEPGSDIRKHADMLLNAVIREALEGSDSPYEIVRSDKVADPGMINDRVIHDILNADLVVADLTFLNANAFYELGLRHAALKPIINFAQIGTELPFDTFGYRAILEDITSWDGIQRARQQIRDQAKVTQAPDYQVSNPITQANASFKMRESADPTERVIADLQIRLERLEDDRAERLEAIDRWSPSVPEVLSFGDMSLGELLHHLPRSATDVDRMLLAGHFIQSRSGDTSFGTGEANALLAEQGVKIGNPSQSVKQNVVARRVFRHQRRYRVSQIGIDHLAQLLGPALMA